MKSPSPLLGFNNNVRHKGRVFHIQTEDSGVRHPHIITHLFADGGRILKTAKTSYAEFIDAPNMGEVVRQMMQDQHKAMFMALRDGQFDPLVDELPPIRGARSPSAQVATVAGAATPPATPAATSPTPAAAATSPASLATAAATASATAATAAAMPAAVAPAAAPPLAASPATATTVPARPAVMPPASMPAPPPLPASPLATTAPDMPRVAPERAPLELPALSPVVPAPLAAPAPSATPQHAAHVRPFASAPTQPAVPVALAPAPVPSVQVINAPPVPTASRPPPATQASPVLRPTPSRLASARPRLDIDPAAIHRAPAPSAVPSGGTLASVVEATVQAAPKAGGRNIDLDTLERAAAEAETPLFQQIRDLPPPPAAVLGPRAAAGAAAGGYSSVTGPAPPPPPSTRGRYAPSRPSSIFASVRPQEGASIFGEDLISEKSLDEVILSYLAEDLDGPGDKK